MVLFWVHVPRRWKVSLILCLRRIEQSRSFQLVAMIMLVCSSVWQGSRVSHLNKRPCIIVNHRKRWIGFDTPTCFTALKTITISTSTSLCQILFSPKSSTTLPSLLQKPQAHHQLGTSNNHWCRKHQVCHFTNCSSSRFRFLQSYRSLSQYWCSRPKW